MDKKYKVIEAPHGDGTDAPETMSYLVVDTTNAVETHKFSTPVHEPVFHTMSKDEAVLKCYELNINNI